MRLAALQRAERLWHTLRHSQPGQLLRRAELRLRLRLAHRMARSERPVPPLATSLPLTPFDPNPSRLAGEDRHRLVLPWGEKPLPAPAAWAVDPQQPDSAAVLNNLHYMEYLEAADDAVLASLVSGWIEAFPLNRPGAVRYAWRPYNLSLRVSAWARELARRGHRLEPTFREKMAASLAGQLDFLASHVETDLRGNHLVKNLNALLWGGAIFTGAAAERWRRIGWHLLAAELKEQILGDGCHYERSPSYHCQVLGDLIEARSLLPVGGLQSRLDEVLGRMTGVALLLAHPDGASAAFNDGGLRMARSPAELAAAFAAVGGRPVEPGDGPFALPDAGYWGLKAAGERVVVDCGPLGPAYLPGHGHADILSLEWSTGGRRILVDQGTYQYAAGRRRFASRSTLSHNTVSVAEAEQHDIHGAFRCGRRAMPHLLSWRPEAGGFAFAGTHDGFDRLPGRPRHIREIEARPGTLHIRDRVEGGAGQAAVSRLLLHPGCTVEIDGHRARLRSGSVQVQIEASQPLEAEPAEWFPDLYCALPTTRLRLAFTAGGPAVEVRLHRLG